MQSNTTVNRCQRFRVSYCLRFHTLSRLSAKGKITLKYSRVLFCDGSFYEDSLLRHLSSRTEHSRYVVHHCRNSSVLSLLSALLALFRCAFVSSFFYFSAVLLSWLWFFHPWHPSKGQKRRKNLTVDVTFFLHAFWTTACAFFSKIKSDLTDFFNYLYNFLYT
jgi:hypothetical protein